MEQAECKRDQNFLSADNDNSIGFLFIGKEKEIPYN